MSRSGFSFIEVLVSVLLIFLFASAVIELNSFAKLNITKTIDSHESVLSSSAILHSKKLDSKTSHSLINYINFDNLQDSQKDILKAITFQNDNEVYPELVIFEGPDKTYKIDYYEQIIKNRDTNLKFLKLGK